MGWVEDLCQLIKEAFIALHYLAPSELKICLNLNLIQISLHYAKLEKLTYL